MKQNMTPYEARKEIKRLINKVDRDIKEYEDRIEFFKNEVLEKFLCEFVEEYNCKVEQLIEYAKRQKQLPGF